MKESTRVRKNKTKNQNFFSKWSSDMAYILGFITADGCIHGNYLTTAVHPKDICVLEYIKKCFETELEIKTKDIYDSRVNKIRQISILTVCSYPMIKDLFELGVTERKTGKEKWPNPPKEFLGDYIRGFLDGDGSIYKRKNQNGLTVSIVSCGKEFLEKIRESLGGMGKIKFSKGTINKVYEYRVFDYYDLLKFKDILYNGNFCLQRKYSKIKDLEGSLTNYRIRKENIFIIEEAYKNGGLDLLKEVCKTMDIKYSTARNYIMKHSPYYKKTVFQWTNKELDLLNNLMFKYSNQTLCAKKASRIINRSIESIRGKIKKIRKLRG